MKNVTYINASAGSGKTYKLTHTLAELIKNGSVKPHQVIMTTFTVKAANEMKEESKKVLYENNLFDEATQLDQAMIGTIHSVANTLINKYWFLMGLSPDMGVMAEEDTQFYVSQSLADLPTDKELKQLHEFCENMGIVYDYNSGKKGLNYDFWKADIEKVIAYTTNYEIDSYETSIQKSLDFIRQFVHGGVDINYSSSQLTAMFEEHEAFLETQKDTQANRDRLEELNRLKRGVNKPNVAWYKSLSALLKTPKNCGPKATAIREKLVELWHSPLVYNEQEQYIKLVFELAERWKERFSTFKKERNLLDYNDMEKYLRDLLENKDIASEISKDFRYLFVDEYQDCSPIQVKIFDRLSELVEHSYWVGDYKQAIYGFRGSDITLTKAVVDRISKGENGCKTDKLDTSYRSLPDIVDVCNETFKRTFSGVLSEDAIVLKKYRSNVENISSLRYWDLRESSDADVLVTHIANLVKSGVDPKDIAVLSRANKPLNKFSLALNKFGIPASKESVPISEMKSTPLVLALLDLIASDEDSLAKATIALLTQEGYDTKKIIEEKLLLDADEQRKAVEYLNDVPLVKRLLELRPLLRQQSVASLVETMIIELDLYNVTKKIDQDNDNSSCLNTIILAARAYEQHCLQMKLSATVSGFKDYLVVMNPVKTGDTNGVQLHTYHGSKGLQWKYVILTQLHEKKNDYNACVRQEIYGVHFNYTEQPSAINPYPAVYISVIPFIYGSSRANVPVDIQQKIEESNLFKDVMKESLNESNRLLYVGMTRPQDVLILALQAPGKGCHSLQWLEDVGLDSVKPDNGPDILGVGCNFANNTLSENEITEMLSYQYATDANKLKDHRIPYQEAACDAEPKYISPSTVQKKGGVVESCTISNRIHLGKLVGKSMADVGDCIHQIFCGIEDNLENASYYTSLIDSYGLAAFLTDYNAIKNAWEQLVSKLTSQFGPAMKIHHERPFTLLKEGQVYTGSIDLVWQTAQGNVIIDFKTCPMGPTEILNAESSHYVGWYAGQLDAYTDALEAAGEKVLKRLIFYPVSGLLVEVSKGSAQ